MSFENVYSTLRSKIGEYFSDRSEMNDPYSPETGKTDDLNSGWGLLVRGEDTQETFTNIVGVQKSYIRSMELLLTNIYVNGRGVPTTRIDKEVKLISDGKALIDWLQGQVATCSLIDSIKLVSDNGIEFINNDRHIAITFNIEITYQE